jgi:hypothetical protein
MWKTLGVFNRLSRFHDCQTFPYEKLNSMRLFDFKQCVQLYKNVLVMDVTLQQH